MFPVAKIKSPPQAPKLLIDPIKSVNRSSLTVFKPKIQVRPQIPMVVVYLYSF